MMKPLRLVLGVAAFVVGCVGLQAQFTWTGLGSSGDISLGANWRGLAAPPNNGTADFYLSSTLNRKLVLPASYSINSIIIGGGETYYIDSASPTTLTLVSGIVAADDNLNQLNFGANVSIGITGSQVLDARGGYIDVAGHITGSGPLALVSTSASGNGFFIFNNNTTGNTYTGSTTVGDGVHSVGVAFWNSSPFGTGAVNVNSAASTTVQFVAHGTQTLTNAFSFVGNGAVQFRTWDAPLTLSGNMTLSSNTIFQNAILQRALAAPNQAGSVPIPGMIQRNPVVFSGTIAESGGSRSLTIGGASPVYFNGTATYTGTTTVNGDLIFGSNASVPTGAITVNSGGYLGFADNTGGALASFLAAHYVTAGSVGAIGVDSLPGSSNTIFGDAINLSTYYSTSLRIGTASSAILTGTITPQAATNYLFGNGGGTLYVQSNLTAATGLTLASSALATPLTLYLQGNNSYTGATTVSNGFLVLDGSGALPASTTLTASGTSTQVGASYIGYTDVAGFASAAAFLAKVNQANTWGILGFDTHQGNSTVSISNINLTGFNDGVFIGTTTTANIDASTLTPSTVTNANNAANTLRFTAAQNGVLTVNGNIGGSLAVMVGTPAAAGPYSAGTVILNGSSTYTGGTTVNAENLSAITLGLGNSSAVGTGTLTFSSSVNGIAGLQATTGGINLANAINLFTVVGAGNAGPRLYFTGTNPFTLSGNITGDTTTNLNLYNPTAITVSLAGDNSGFLGDILVHNGTLAMLNNAAAGLGTLYFSDASTGTVSFGGAATNPVLYGIDGNSGTISIANTTNLTFNVSDALLHEGSFRGLITGAGAITVTAPTAPTTNALYLGGANTYSGGTTILNRAVLGLGNNTAAGTGAVTLNAPNGGLILNSGVTFTNPLTFTSGALGGFGTFAPSGTSNITFDTGRILAPGVPGFVFDPNISVGALQIATDVTFANGGTFIWGLQDVSRADGMSLVNITGNLFITASAGGFTLKLETFDVSNAVGFANLTLGTPYSLPILTTTGSITGFNAGAFTIDATSFQGGTLAPTVFTLSQSGSTLYLNFTPVPEPSTYALLGLGLSTLLVPALRRRRR